MVGRTISAKINSYRINNTSHSITLWLTFVYTLKGCGVKNPRMGKFETNIHAKEWILVDPHGKVYKIKNLRNWARSNCHLFQKETSEKSAAQIASGFIQIKRAAEGKRKYIANAYKGWTLKFDI